MNARSRYWNPLVAAFRVHLQLEAITPFALIVTMLTPLVFGILVASTVAEPGLSVVIGTGFAGMVGLLIPQAVFVIVEERSWLTLEQVALSGVHTAVVLAGRLVAVTAQAVIAMPIGWVAIVVIFGPVAVPSPLWTALAIVIGTVGFFAISLIILGFIARRRYRSGMPNGLFPLLVLLAGLFVPVSALPSWLAFASRLLAPTWAMEALRRIEVGQSPRSELGIGAAVAVVTVILGLIYVGRTEEEMRRSPEAYLR